MIMGKVREMKSLLWKEILQWGIESSNAESKVDIRSFEIVTNVGLRGHKI